MEGIGGHSTHGRALGDWHHTLVRSARAFGPGGRWMWGVLVVPSITVVVAHHHGCQWVVAREHWEWGNWHRTLVRNAWALGPGGQGNGGDVAGGL